MSTCAITGTNGYLGGRLKVAFTQRQWRVLELSRQPRSSDGIKFQLGDELPPDKLRGLDALIHCAYDFKAVNWEDIRERNVLGTGKLLHAARSAGVRQLIYISSISSFEGAHSLYGRAKLAAEQLARECNAFIIRPGLIHGEIAGAMFGKLRQQVASTSLLPLFGGGEQVQYLVHEADLCAFVCECAEGKHAGFEGRPITIASEEPWTFRQILEQLAREKGKRLRFLPLPWRLLWAGLKTAEICRVPLNFRSDSLISLMNQNPSPDFTAKRELGIQCRPFVLR